MTDWYNANKIAESRYKDLSQHAAEGYQRRLMRKNRGRGLSTRVAAIFDSASSAFDAGGLSARSAKTVKNLWWVPAGIAVLLALRAIVGG
jgi:hypothetical protein